MSNPLQLGQSANLLYGYQPVWDPTGSDPYPFFAPDAGSPPSAVELVTPQYVPPQYHGHPATGWSNYATISLHESAESLLSGIYNYSVSKLETDPAGVDVPAGPLALGDADSHSALAAAGEFLGLDLNADQSYMLVTMERVTGVATHPFVSNPGAQSVEDYLTPAAKAAIDQLTPAKAPEKGSALYDSKLTLADANTYVSTLYELGTHFVGQIVQGDMLVQVFAYGADQFKIVQKEFDYEANGASTLTGSAANGFQLYTSPCHSGPSGTYGYVADYGTLLLLSRDPALQTSIDAGDWNTPQTEGSPGTPSIFAGVTDIQMFNSFNSKVTIGLTMTPVAGLFPNPQVAGPWDRLVKGGLLQKYGGAVTVPMMREIEYDWVKIFPQSADSLEANIVTPVIDVYQERIDLADVNLQGASVLEDVGITMQSFTSFSQVLQATTAAGDPAIALPSDNVIIIAQIIDTTQAAQTPVISLNSDTALKQLTVLCEDMYGALVFETGSTRKVALEGFLFETLSTPDPATHRFKVDLSAVLTDSDESVESPPSSPDVTPLGSPGGGLIDQLKQSIEFSIVAGESLMHAQGDDAETVRALEVSYLRWLAGLIPSDTNDNDLANNRARALYLANNVATFGQDVVYVPYVTYEGYKDYVTDLTQEALSLQGTIQNYQEQINTTINDYKIMDSIANVNDNIKAIGGVLTQYFAALAQGREQMDGYYNSIIAELKKELTETQANILSLKAKLDAQQNKISGSGSPPSLMDKVEHDIIAYENDQIAQCVMSGVGALFSLGVSMAGIPEAAEGGILKALEAIQDTVEKIQAVMEVLEKLAAIEEEAQNMTEKVNELSSVIESNQSNLQMPSQVDLELMGQNINAALTGISGNSSLKQDQADLVAAVNGMVIIGSALLQAQTKVSQILVQIQNTNRLKTINASQQSAMSGLSHSLHLGSSTKPDYNSINLVGATGQLQYQLKQVLATLAQTLELQDGAVQYEYFGTPATLTSFSLLNLQSTISNQANSVIHGVAGLNPQPQKVNDPVRITIPCVKRTNISGGNVLMVTVQLNCREFWNYDMVRIDRVIPNITGIKSTDSGKYEIHLQCQAKPFHDRNYSRENKTFASAMRILGPYVYDITGSPNAVPDFGANTGVFSDTVTHVTPFSQWVIGLPDDVTNNQGIEFDSELVDIELDFYVTARYDDSVAPPSSPPEVEITELPEYSPPELQEIAAAPAAAGGGARLSAALMSMDAGGSSAAVASSPSSPDLTPGTLAYLESNIFNNQEVLNGWDAMFCVIEEPVNAFLHYQFLEYIKKLNSLSSPGDDMVMNIDTGGYCEDVQSVHGLTMTNTTSLNFRLSNPLLRFVPGVNYVSVQQYILSGTVAAGSMSCTTDFVPEDCNLPNEDVNFTVDSTGSPSPLKLSINDVFANGMQVYLTTTGTLPAPLQAGTLKDGPYYWVMDYHWSYPSSGPSSPPDPHLGTTTILLAENTRDQAPGTIVAVTDPGTGVHSVVPAIFPNQGSPYVVNPSDNPYIQASVDLNAIAGIVESPGTGNNTHTVVLDFGTGAFSLQNFKVVGTSGWDPAHHATQISSNLANWFHYNEVIYQVQTINYANLSQDTSLQPTKFKLNSRTTNLGNNILEMWIATTSPEQNDVSTGIQEPIAYDPANPVPGSSDFNVSLLISSKLTFQHIFVDSFNKGGTNMTVEAVDPGVGFKAYSAKLTQGTDTAQVPWQNPYKPNSGNNLNYDTNFRIAANQNGSNAENQIIWDLAGMTFQHSQDAGIALHYTNGTDGSPINFQYQQHEYQAGYCGAPGYWYWTSWTSAQGTAFITMTGSYPLQVTGSGSQQLVKFKTTTPDVDFPGSHLPPPGACECNDNAIINALIAALKSTVPGALQSYMNEITFSPISVFALENLLFPADQFITMKYAGVPGDLLVAGEYLSAVRKATTNHQYNITIVAAANGKGSFLGEPFQNGGSDDSPNLPQSVTKNNVTNEPVTGSNPITFEYGSVFANQATYKIDIEAGTISPSGLMALVVQPDPDNHPEEVVILPPGFIKPT